MKKLSLIMAMAIFSATNVSAADAPINSLEILDPDYQGGSFDYQTEIERKVNELDQLQFTTEQSNKIKDIVLNHERVLSTPYTNVPTPVTRSLNVKFTAGLTPPVLRLSYNMLTTVVFTDAAGNPWDITSVSINKKLFNAGGTSAEATTQSPQIQSSSGEDANTSIEDMSPHNILTLEPLNPAAYGNITVTLDGLATPVIFILTTGQAETDMRVDARISSINKSRSAKNGSLNGIGGANGYSNPLSSLDDSTLLFADGTPPDEAVRLKTSSNEIEAWLYQDDLIARTTSTILYPSFKSSVTSTGGVSVYKFDPENQSITVSDKSGQPKTIYVENE